MKLKRLWVIVAAVHGVAACQGEPARNQHMDAVCRNLHVLYPTPNMTITLPDNHDWPCWDHGGKEAYFAEFRDRKALDALAAAPDDNLGLDVIGVLNRKGGL